MPQSQKDSVNQTIERNLGEQPITDILKNNKLRGHDLVAASDEHITHKMVTKACKGRRLTKKVQRKIINAVNKALEKDFSKEDLFNY